MISLPIDKIKKEVNTIYNLLGSLLNYLDVADKTIKRLIHNRVPLHVVRSFCLAWQYQRNEIKAKQPQRKKYFAMKKDEQNEMMDTLLAKDYQPIKDKVFEELDKIIQSSAMVENINSIVRAYLNTSRNQINQEMLNLIMFYHNHRVYKSGKRKGGIPIELLTKEKQSKYGLETDILWPFVAQATRTHFTIKLWQKGNLRGDIYAGVNIDFPRDRETEGRFADYSLASGYRQYFWKGLHMEFSQTTGLGVLQDHVSTGKIYNSFDWLVSGYIGYKFEFAKKNICCLLVVPNIRSFSFLF